MAKFSILTLGCKVNQCESAAFEDQLKSAGYEAAKPSERADICIVNTCAVTGKAAMQSRQAIRGLVRNHPTAKIIVTGCYAEAAAGEIGTIPGVHRVAGLTDKAHTVDLALELMAEPGVARPPIGITTDHSFFPRNAKPAGGRTRPFLKVQDGCDAFCTYCIVPHTRGRSRSLPPEKVLENLREFNRLGFHEVVLTGIHLGGYGKDLFPSTSLTELLCRIVQEKVMDRVRLSSIEPMELTRGLIDLAGETERICPHFHIPLQSGDDDVLRRMHRPYTRHLFSERVLMIKEKMPHASVGVDILAGFPGETPQAFENTRQLIENLPVSYLHVFPFSPRKGTPAASYPEQVQNSTVKERCEMLRRLGQKKKEAFYASQVGRTLRVIVEGGEGTQLRQRGMSENYIPVVFSLNLDLENQMVSVLVDRVVDEKGVFGTLV